MQSFEQKFDYIAIGEPDHLKSGNSTGNIDNWYVEQHKMNLNLFCASNNKSEIIMERSIISSMAYFYAIGENGETKHAL